MEDENTFKGTIVEAIKRSCPDTKYEGTTLTVEMLRNTIQDLLNSAKDYQEVTAYYYCEGLGKLTTTRWDRPYTCEHPKCSFCRDMEKAIKDELGMAYQYQPEIPEMKTNKKTISNGFHKVKKGSKFTKKKKRNR